MNSQNSGPADETPASDPKPSDDGAVLTDTAATNGTVGYGRPPIHTRFKPGQSGNPLGRRRVPTSVSIALSTALEERVSITQGKTRKSGSKARALLVSLVAKALQGDMKALASVVKIGVKVGNIKPAPVIRRGGVLTMPPSFWKLSPREQAIEIEKAAARRDANLARRLGYRNVPGTNY